VRPTRDYRTEYNPQRPVIELPSILLQQLAYQFVPKDYSFDCILICGQLLQKIFGVYESYPATFLEMHLKILLVVKDN